MTDRELLNMALEALDSEATLNVGSIKDALRERLAQPEQTVPSDHSNSHQPEQSPLDRMAENARELGLDYEPVQEPVAHSIVAGALFDFMGWLTTRRERLVLSSSDDAAPAADAIKDFAQMRSLSINDAQVQEWQKHLATPPRREWVGLTDGDKAELDEKYGDDPLAHLDAIEAKLKEKNA